MRAPVPLWMLLLAAGVSCLVLSERALTAAEPAKGSDESKREEIELRRKEYQLKLKEHELTTWGFCGTGLALAFGFIQYRRADKWKRGEFLAKEMKDFFDDRAVQKVLTMIDWGARSVNLFDNPDPDPKKHSYVTRDVQIAALKPHTMLRHDSGSDATPGPQERSEAETTLSTESNPCTFQVVQARIRDCYDRFLDGLGRFASYVESGLISRKELDPYLEYWINDIAAYTTNPEDAAWTCTLFAYIEFYDFKSVQNLFVEYGYVISTTGRIFQKQGQKAPDLASRLKAECKKKRDGQKEGDESSGTGPETTHNQPLTSVPKDF
jgi:hypothetical protein